jgi:hypothetical protein
MAKSIKCKVIVHGIRREIDWGEFPSITKAKESLRYWSRPYTIKRLTDI